MHVQKNQSCRSRQEVRDRLLDRGFGQLLRFIGYIPIVTEKLVLDCVGFAPDFLSSFAPCSRTRLLTPVQKIWGASWSNSQFFNLSGYIHDLLGSETRNFYHPLCRMAHPLVWSLIRARICYRISSFFLDSLPLFP